MEGGRAFQRNSLLRRGRSADKAGQVSVASTHQQHPLWEAQSRGSFQGGKGKRQDGRSQAQELQRQGVHFDVDQVTPILAAGRQRCAGGFWNAV